MSRNCQNLCLPPSSCYLPTRCPISCSIICCIPPVNYRVRVPCVQYRIVCPPQSMPKSAKKIIYLPPCPTCSTSSPSKMEMTSYSPSTSSPTPCFYVCNANCVPCTPCPPISCNSPCKDNKLSLCLPCPLAK